MRSSSSRGRTCIIGFDSAWTDSPKSPGAACAIVITGVGARFTPPELATFDDALRFIEAERAACDTCLVALDQPTIVPNSTGCRPVDRVAGSLVSFVGGGVQPANRSKAGMFDDEAPIWRFLNRLAATQDPEGSRVAEKGLFLVEVFPALALPSIDLALYGRGKHPKYNPKNRNFRTDDWFKVVELVAQYGHKARIEGVEVWAHKMKQDTLDRRPRKADQDRLDAVICALVGYHWRAMPRQGSIMIGDLDSGCMISPATRETRAHLAEAAERFAVAVDGSRRP